MSEEIKDILEELEDCKTTKYLNYNLDNKDARNILNYIASLQQKVEQLENIRKEVIDYIKNDSYFDGSSICANDLLNILNKGENNE